MRFKNTLTFIFYFFSKTAAQPELKLLPDLGIAFEKHEKFIITNGVNTAYISLKLDLPKVERVARDQCRANKTDNGFDAAVSQAETQFVKQTADELEAYTGEEMLPPKTPVESGDPDDKFDYAGVLDMIKKDPRKCGQNSTTCHFYPAMANDRDHPDLFEIKPCSENNVGQVGRYACRIDSGASICCSRVEAENKGKCPEMTEALNTIYSYERVYPRKIFTYGEKQYKISELKTYCIGVQFVMINGKKHGLPLYVDRQTRGKRRHFPQSISRHRSRARRSTWNYISSGWIFNSRYIDDSLKHEHDLEKADITLVKDALQKNTKVLLSLQADKSERIAFQKAVCSLSEDITKKMILDELHLAQQNLLNKAESMLRQCTAGLVPDNLSNDHLRKLCASVSASKHCLGHQVRSLFKCDVIRPTITVQKVGINFELELSIPIDEVYTSSIIHAIGVPFSSNAIDISRNITEIELEKELETASEAPKNDVEQILKQLFKKISETRRKREIVSSYHFLRIRNLPQILVTHENDMLAFDKSDCHLDPRSQFFTCDYSLTRQTEIECIKGMTEGLVDRIEHYCELDLFSSNYPCVSRVIDGMGYLVSSHTSVPIHTGAKSKIFTNQNTLNKCTKVCAILINGNEQSFQCGNRDFVVEPSQSEEINFAATRIKNIDLKKLAMTRKHDVSQLELSGFDLIDSSLSKHDMSRITTISSTFSIVGIVVISLMILLKFWSCIVHKMKLCWQHCWPSCCRQAAYIEQIPFHMTDRVIAKRKLNSRYAK